MNRTHTRGKGLTIFFMVVVGAFGVLYWLDPEFLFKTGQTISHWFDFLR
jgi:hypothetical protein